MTAANTLSTPYRRVLPIAALALAAYAAYTFWPESNGGPMFASATPEAVETAELRLTRLRAIAATAPAKEDVLKKVNADLAEREKGLLRPETVAQAQAQLFTLLRNIGMEDGIEVRQSQLMGVTEIADRAYGLAPINVQFECRIEQLVNFLAALGAQEELIVTRGLQVEASDTKMKTVRVRLTAGAVVPQEMLPVKGGQK